MNFWIFNKFMSNIHTSNIETSLIMAFTRILSVSLGPGPHEM